VIRVALDVLGGDAAANTPIMGALAALDAWPDELSVSLVGPPDEIECRLEAEQRRRISIIPATQTIEQGEPPALAVRRKPDSSIVRGLEAVRDGNADALISAGSTGAVMAASVLTLGVLPGVDRPPVGAMFPTASGQMLVVDVGAHVNARPHQLHQYARLGSIYLRDSYGIAKPKVGLLNVGEEVEKGDEVTVAAYPRLANDENIDFVGNVEGHQIIAGPCDVLVCTGFVGNALLKFYESMAVSCCACFASRGSSRKPRSIGSCAFWTTPSTEARRSWASMGWRSSATARLRLGRSRTRFVRRWMPFARGSCQT